MSQATVTVVNDTDFVELIALDGAPREGRVRLVFAEDIGPVSLKVKNPDGKVVLDRVLREVPTRDASLSPPLCVPVAATGDYAIEVRPLAGSSFRGPLRDPWELDDSLRRAPQLAQRVGAALLRVA